MHNVALLSASVMGILLIFAGTFGGCAPNFGMPPVEKKLLEIQGVLVTLTGVLILCAVSIVRAIDGHAGK